MSIQRPAASWNIIRPPVHPGEMVREEFLCAVNLTADTLARELQMPETEVAEILTERRGISPLMAAQLERRFGMSAEFWMNLQWKYERRMIRQTWKSGWAVAESQSEVSEAMTFHIEG